ncbi:sulfate/molybdate ABC transporter ATP-binding protein [Geofilum rubicundum]|uniref:Molybdenum transport ATP-binding protein ModC n=1 Tax=Geofilum rubicundum JCM 15548 TaxID=1236989 RepID=A0A0E9LTC6_9BACT|nr:ATP-binding cassette domain-containing protein [Geofilum rubicundum]GAO28543.1 molybdenum transport ATP-binding protein ModC [Geofilum rubicundum JCM 15548]
MENDVIEIDVQKELVSAHGRMTLTIKVKLLGGELVVLFGESGAGKTTLLRMISGLTNPDRGILKVGNSVWFDSDAGINKPPQERNIGFVFQDYALFPNMSVFNNVAYGQTQGDKCYVNELLQKFGLEELSARKPDKLSGGQRQRVALARALARKPDFLLLDEPLSALDGDIRTSLQNEILKAHGINNATTLLVSHDLTEVFRLAHKVLQIKNGTITGMGKPDQLFLNNQISGKVQITGSIVKIQKQDAFYLLTVVTGMNQILKVTAFQNDIEKLSEGDRVMVFSKAFSPLILKM